MPKKAFKPSPNAETAFARQLKKIARVSGHIVEAHIRDNHIWNVAELDRQLKAYSEMLGPWAERQAAKMLARINRKSKTAFTKNSKEMGKLIKSDVAEGLVGKTAQDLMDEQVFLIKSIPLNTAKRAQKLSQEAVYSGQRADEVAKELMRSGKVSESDAVRIARTEVARSNSTLTQARAMSVGSTHYRWRNSGDAAVRDSHKKYKGKKLDGMIIAWDKPLTLDDGTTGHPGTFVNCRCYPEPVFENDEE